jgi:hypothetical protein
MARPMITGDTAGLFYVPGSPPTPFTSTATTGSTKVRIRGSSVILDGSGQGTTPGGPGVYSGNLGTSAKVRIEGQFVLLDGGQIGAVGSYSGPGTITATNATNISVS